MHSKAPQMEYDQHSKTPQMEDDQQDFKGTKHGILGKAKFRHVASTALWHK